MKGLWKVLKPRDILPSMRQVVDDDIISHWSEDDQPDMESALDE